MSTSHDDDVSAAVRIVRDLWPDLIVDVRWDNSRVVITVDAELAPRVRPGQLPPLLENRARVYAGRTWQEAIRTAGKRESVNATKVEDRIATVERAVREGRTVYFTEWTA